MTAQTKQLLPKATYFDPTWFERERRELFDQAWVFAGISRQLDDPGDFLTLRFMDHPLLVVRDGNGDLRAFHNLCRHRGCEVLEDAGNTGDAIMCPYHRWTYQLDGALRGVPNEAECFDGLAKGELGLLPASVGEYAGMVFVNPSPAPKDDFAAFIANLDEHRWPHAFDAGDMQYSGEVVYEMHCNWKVFYENAVDGYHLGYLHDQTLGRVYPSKNVWEMAGRNHVWYSTEWEGERRSNTKLSVQMSDRYNAPRLHEYEETTYPGVVMLFPLTILSPSPWGFYVSVLEPKGPELTYMRTLAWAPGDGEDRFGISGKRAEPVRLEDLDKHPLESGNFQLEDMWIVEKVQRNLHSPNYQVGPLAQGDGAENPLTEFQRQILEFVPSGESACNS